MKKLACLQIRNPKDDKNSIESAFQFFSSIIPKQSSLIRTLFLGEEIFSFEVYSLGQTIYFYIVVPYERQSFIKSVFQSVYPQAKIVNTTDPIEIFFKFKNMSLGQLSLSDSYYYPIKSYDSFSKVDPLSSMLGFLSKQSSGVNFVYQLVLGPVFFNWQKKLISLSEKSKEELRKQSIDRSFQKSSLIKKASSAGARFALRLGVSLMNDQIQADRYLIDFAGTFGVFNAGDGNSFVFKKVKQSSSLVNKLRYRSLPVFGSSNQILNAEELATIWHPAGESLSNIKNISWGKTLKGEPPENLPTSDYKNKEDINFFAKTEFKNSQTIFGIKTADRRKHVYIIGKTGAGKSTLIANMAIDDIRRGRGIGIIDPHGDLSEIVLDYVPKRRVNDVVYLEPFDTQRPFSLNVLDVANKQQKDLVASGIVSIFYKLYKDSWGPRLEYILRNVVLTLLESDNATLVDILPLLSDKKFRQKVIEKIKDDVIKNFWLNEFEKMPDRLRSEAVSPIQNKVGQFASSKMIRNIIGSKRSTINLEQIMNEGKILILNLSQGKLGEDNSALLGAMIITQMQLAAMNRSFQKEEERKDFFLYVDEFQNFATTSFVKILSEARKYRLSLTMANQYIDQIDESVRRAIFGNVGTLISFVVGAKDAEYLSKEFGRLYSADDLVNLGKFEIVMKLSIDGLTSSPFPANTLPLPDQRNHNKEKIIRISKERYGRSLTSDFKS
ncbi:MAG: hypothetical protein KatS3mg090_0094 [Patescibacteria group bacterium]|nr:MAG: hypothetical protein KatS3mg090_0094 [Patescibacteria group bacterium]